MLEPRNFVIDIPHLNCTMKRLGVSITISELLISRLILPKLVVNVQPDPSQVIFEPYFLSNQETHYLQYSSHKLQNLGSRD